MSEDNQEQQAPVVINTPEEYLENVLRTFSTENCDARKVDPVPLLRYLTGVIRSGDKLDAIKKELAYLPLEKAKDYTFNWTHKTGVKNKIDSNILHCLLGIITEAAEVATLLHKYIETGSFDAVNALEESGDLDFYQAALDCITEQSQQKRWIKNINKLRARFPSKFSSEKAYNRDLEAERKILEEGMEDA